MATIIARGKPQRKLNPPKGGFNFEESALSGSTALTAGDIFLLKNKSNGHIIFVVYYVYIIKNSSGKLYVGITEDLEKRLHYHNTRQGAQFTKTKSKFAFIFHEQYQTLAEARRREIQIKKWRRDKKEVLIERFKKGLPTKPG